MKKVSFKEIPIRYASDFIPQLKELKREGRARKGVSTGYVDLDHYMTIVKGLLTVATGYPSSGKSEFIDQLCLNYAILHGWKTLYFSPENYPVEEHVRKIMERYIGKELYRFSTEEFRDAVQWVDEHIGFIELPEDVFGYEAILEAARQEYERRPFDVMVFDPWNEVDNFAGQREDLHVSKIITAIKRFLRTRDIHGIIIAHPRTPHEKVTDAEGRKDYPIPKLYDISGGAIWRNKAEYGLVVHRYPTDNYMRLQIQKIKQKSLGQIGELIFHYDRASGRFRTESQSDFSLPYPDGNEPPF